MPSFTPQSHAQWNGTSPPRSGLAIESEEFGTLGVALRVAGTTYFTCARHVAGDSPPAVPQPVGVCRTNGSYIAAQSLLRQKAEPALASDLDNLDLAFLQAPSDARNVLPNGHALGAIGVVVAGDQLEIRGCRHADWITTTYQSHFIEEYKASFDALPYDLDHFGIIELGPLGPASQQPGNSGSVLWLNDGGGFQAVGHLVQVSLVHPIALIVRYRSAFEALGLGAATVI